MLRIARLWGRRPGTLEYEHHPHIKTMAPSPIMCELVVEDKSGEEVGV